MAKFDRGRSYGLDRDEALGEGLKRVAAGRVEGAIERLRGIGSGEVEQADAVHGARKDMKRLRTVLRLLRDELPEDVYEQEMQCYRGAGRALSAARDAEVKLATLDDLAGRTEKLPGEAVQAWRQILARDRDAAVNLSGDEQEVIDRLEAGLARIEGWRLEGESWESIDGGLRRAYRRGRQAMRDAEDEPSEENFHQWRKRAKDLWYALQLVSGAWSETLDPFADEAHRLSDLLGDHHDLAVMRGDLRERRLGEEETRLLEAAIEARQAGLAREAFDLGRRLYAEPPKAFARRLRRYWEAWRGKVPSVAPRTKQAGKSKKALGEYERKRDFEKTSEPAPKRRRKKKGAPRFVVQEHSARRLHWDLRLEHDGVAASWAIPNGIPETPDENRKAVHTEDHPLDYLEWEGEIPQGEYGAGTMKIWDSGTYELEKWEPEKVMVEFHGERLQGRYALFRAGKADKDWMIHRIDPPARPRDSFPENVVPMLARLSTLPRDDGNWAVEVKWDGVRAIAYCRPGRVELQSRNLLDVSAQYPEVRRISRALGSHEAVLDGELVAFDEDGRPSFERLQQRIHNTDENVVRRRMKTHPVVYIVFDLLYLDGEDLMGESYTRRRELLEGLELDGESWQTPGHSVGHAKELLEASKEQGLEGVMLKRLDATYAPGKRTGAWLKVKNVSRQELVIGGWTPGEGRRKEHLGALLVGYFEQHGSKRGESKGLLRYAGKVGTGFTAADLTAIAARLAPLERKTSPFGAGPKPPKDAIFVEPRLVAEIEFREMTKEGILRHPAYKGLREDKPASEVELERVSDPQGRSLTAGAVKRPRNKVAVTVEGRELELSNLGKVLYPQTGFTKGELIDWYARIAEFLLPHLRGRPLTLKRYPEGVEGKHFYEKRCPAHRPEWVNTAKIWSDRHKGEIDYCLVEDLPALVWAANLADIELHTSLSRAEEMERPTAMVFDLDPGAPAGVLDCAQVALWLQGLFEQLGLSCHPKTSGSKGIQLYVPLNSDVTYAQTKPFAKAVAETLDRKFPERAVSQMSKAKRPGKVLIDWSQNDVHKTTVCVYSLRAKERPTVSTPLEWSEVEAALAAGEPEALAFDHAAVLERVEAKGDLFAPLLSEEQELPQL